MSQENVELVRRIYPPPEVDYVQLCSDDTLWTEWAEVVAPLVHTDFACVMYDLGGKRRYDGLDGVRAFMLDWTAPWATYQIEIEEAIDLGERVLLLNDDRGRRDGSTQEVRGRVGAVFTVSDGKIARLDVYTTRGDAFKAAGLGDERMSHENVEVARRFIEAILHTQASDDFEPAIAELTSDVEIDDQDIRLDTELYRGRDRLRKWIGVWNESWESWKVEDVVIQPVGEDRVIALFLMRVKGKGSGIELSRRDALVCKLRGGKIAELAYYNDQQQALKVVGLEQ
jgi:ketosteroid isomerase-like protein